MAKKRLMLRKAKEVTAKEAKLAAEFRLHARHNELVKTIDQVREKLSGAADYETERRLSSELCELEIELVQVDEAIAKSEGN